VRRHSRFRFSPGRSIRKARRENVLASANLHHYWAADSLMLLDSDMETGSNYLAASSRLARLERTVHRLETLTRAQRLPDGLVPSGSQRFFC
jgi:hypothetical protein